MRKNLFIDLITQLLCYSVLQFFNQFLSAIFFLCFPNCFKLFDFCIGAKYQ
jgi:hypothetical protein